MSSVISSCGHPWSSSASTTPTKVLLVGEEEQHQPQEAEEKQEQSPHQDPICGKWLEEDYDILVNFLFEGKTNKSCHEREDEDEYHEDERVASSSFASSISDEDDTNASSSGGAAADSTSTTIVDHATSTMINPPRTAVKEERVRISPVSCQEEKEGREDAASWCSDATSTSDGCHTMMATSNKKRRVSGEEEETPMMAATSTSAGAGAAGVVALARSAPDGRHDDRAGQDEQEQQKKQNVGVPSPLDDSSCVAFPTSTNKKRKVYVSIVPMPSTRCMSFGSTKTSIWARQAGRRCSKAKETFLKAVSIATRESSPLRKLVGSSSLSTSSSSTIKNSSSSSSSSSTGGTSSSSTDDMMSAEELLEFRRERNRILARQTRERKKSQLSTLKQQFLAVQQENYILQCIVRDHLPGERGQDILTDCHTALSKVPREVWDATKDDIPVALRPQQEGHAAPAVVVEEITNAEAAKARARSDACTAASCKAARPLAKIVEGKRSPSSKVIQTSSSAPYEPHDVIAGISSHAAAIAASIVSVPCPFSVSNDKVEDQQLPENAQQQEEKNAAVVAQDHCGASIGSPSAGFLISSGKCPTSSSTRGGGAGSSSVATPRAQICDDDDDTPSVVSRNSSSDEDGNDDGNDSTTADALVGGKRRKNDVAGGPKLGNKKSKKDSNSEGSGIVKKVDRSSSSISNCTTTPPTRKNPLSLFGKPVNLVA